jgi:hypothetical protein
MDKDRVKRQDFANGTDERLRDGDEVRFLLRREKQILQSIAVDMPVPELLDGICNALDCEIGDVVSQVSLLDEDATELDATAKKARHLGLHMFCSTGVMAENGELLGILEMYCCKHRGPSPQDLGLIERAACLAAMAIESGNGAWEPDEPATAEMRLMRMGVRNSPETLN